MYDLVVLGGGSGGLNVASAAARVGAKVALIEKYRLGGECTHTACVPSKALIEAARLAHRIRSADAMGIRVGPIDVDFDAVMRRVRAVVSEFAGSGSGDSLRAKGIDVYRGSPVFEAYDTVLVDGTTRISGQKFVIATGSRPKIPDIPGLAEAGYHDYTTIWNLTELPASLTVLGAGPTGLELRRPSPGWERRSRSWPTPSKSSPRGPRGLRARRDLPGGRGDHLPDGRRGHRRHDPRRLEGLHLPG
ncbi:MAG: FAD-dependent oxidoreductase [Singulisphaera sp.]